MTGIRRFPSCGQRLGRAFLSQKLAGAEAYGRIVGLFRCPVLELARRGIVAKLSVPW